MKSSHSQCHLLGHCSIPFLPSVTKNQEKRVKTLVGNFIFKIILFYFTENQIPVLAAENITLLYTNQEPAQAAAPAAISPELGEKATELAAVTTELASATSQSNKTETAAKALATSPVIVSNNII